MTSPAQSTYLKTRVSLLARLKGESSDEAWHELYQTYWRAIYGYALRFGMARADVEDVVQEVFIKLCRTLPAFNYDPARGRFLSLVKTVTRTTVADCLRRRRVRMAVGQGGNGDGKEMPVPAGGGDLWQEEWEASLLALALERVEARVNAKTFEAFRRFALEGQSAEAVAAALELSPNAIYMAKARVLRRLKAEVAVIRRTVL